MARMKNVNLRWGAIRYIYLMAPCRSTRNDANQLNIKDFILDCAEDKPDQNSFASVVSVAGSAPEAVRPIGCSLRVDAPGALYIG